MGGATGGVGDILSPHFGTSGGAVQWKWSLLLQQTVFIQYCTSDWISTPLTLVDTCQVNDIWKDGLGRVSTVHPHWTAALFKSRCQHAHAAVNWLSMSLSRHTCQISLASSYFPASSSLIRWYVLICIFWIYSTGPYWCLLACTPHIWKSGGTNFFFRSLLVNPVLYPSP